MLRLLFPGHNLNHTVDVCPRIALLEHGTIIRDIRNENNSAEKETRGLFQCRRGRIYSGRKYSGTGGRRTERIIFQCDNMPMCQLVVL